MKNIINDIKKPLTRRIILSSKAARNGKPPCGFCAYALCMRTSSSMVPARVEQPLLLPASLRIRHPSRLKCRHFSCQLFLHEEKAGRSAGGRDSLTCDSRRSALPCRVFLQPLCPPPPCGGHFYSRFPANP